MENSTLLTFILVLPWFSACVNLVLQPSSSIRKYINFLIAFSQFLASYYFVMESTVITISLPIIISKPSVVYFTDPLSGYFALGVSLLWLITNIYSSGYIKNHNILASSRQETSINSRKFFVCVSLAIGCTINLAFAGNLFTIFVFYELLTLVTYPIVVSDDIKGQKAGIKYLLYLLIPSLTLVLPIIIITLVITGESDFSMNGALFGKISDYSLLALLLFGIIIGTSKIALPPLHNWLPSAMVAPAPVSGLLHAVAVVKSGIFMIAKIIIYVFGFEQLKKMNLANNWFTDWITLVACLAIIYASFKALKQTDLKKLLAFSTITNLSYCLLAFSFITPESLTIGLLYALSHSFAKLTLFLVTGSFFTTVGKTQIIDLDGIGKIMPLNKIAFTISALAIIGIPPSITIFTKYMLLKTSYSNSLFLLVLVTLIFSTLVTAKYFLSIIYKAFYGQNSNYVIYSKPTVGMNIAIIFTTIITIYLYIVGYQLISANHFVSKLVPIFN